MGPNGRGNCFDNDIIHPEANICQLSRDVGEFLAKYALTTLTLPKPNCTACEAAQRIHWSGLAILEGCEHLQRQA